MTLLAEPVPLHDVRDVEATCRSILDRTLREYRSHTMDQDDYDDVLATFIGVAYEWSLKHDPERELEPGQTRISFNTYLNRYLGPRLADWFRWRYGDARYGPPPEVVWLDDELESAITVTSSRSTLTEAAYTYEEVETRASVFYPSRIGVDEAA